MYFSDLMFFSPGLYLCVSEKKGLTSRVMFIGKTLDMSGLGVFYPP